MIKRGHKPQRSHSPATRPLTISLNTDVSSLENQTISFPFPLIEKIYAVVSLIRNHSCGHCGLSRLFALAKSESFLYVRSGVVWGGVEHNLINVIRIV